MNLLMKLMGAASIAALAGANAAYADVSEATLKSLGAPDRIETSIGTLEFKDGAPTVETAQKVFDTLDFTRAERLQQQLSRRVGLRDPQGLPEHRRRRQRRRHILRTDGLGESCSSPANADTVYYIAVVDLSKGPMVIETAVRGARAPSTTCGSRGSSTSASRARTAARAASILLVPPGYDGPLPDGGFYVAHSRTNRVLYAARSFLANDDPEADRRAIKKQR